MLFRSAGSLGKKLLRVTDVMHQGGDLPMVQHDAKLRDAIMEISRHRLGITGISQDGQLSGCLSDGDLRRILESGHMDLDAPVRELMHSNPMKIESGKLASEALHVMEEHKIMVLFVYEGTENNIVGIVHMHDILQGGL